MAITKSDVLKIRDDVVAAATAAGVTLTAAEVVQGTRTMVHAALSLEKPAPYPLPPAPPGKSRADFLARMRSANRAELKSLNDEEHALLATRKAQMHLSVPPEVHVAFQQASETEKYGIRDAHHFAQKEHGKALWEETNSLVAQALESN